MKLPFEWIDFVHQAHDSQVNDTENQKENSSLA